MSDFHCPADWHFSPPCVEVPSNRGHENDDAPHSVPEPGTELLLAVGLVVLILTRRRK